MGILEVAVPPAHHNSPEKLCMSAGIRERMGAFGGRARRKFARVLQCS